MAKIKAVPGKEGHVWIPGPYTGLSYTTDGGKTITKIEDVARCDVVGFGKAKDGEDYLAIYITGEIDGLYAVYRSDDMGKSWVRVNDDQHQYGSINYSITGDLRVYGRVFVATNGRGIVYGEPSSDSPVPTPTPPPTPKDVGDINSDGAINSLDYSLLGKHILEIEKLTKEQISRADVNFDGVIDTRDCVVLQRYILEIIDSF